MGGLVKMTTECPQLNHKNRDRFRPQETRSYRSEQMVAEPSGGHIHRLGEGVSECRSVRYTTIMQLLEDTAANSVSAALSVTSFTGMLYLISIDGHSGALVSEWLPSVQCSLGCRVSMAHA